MTALTVAGFDPSGGAGIIADLNTFFSLGLQGSAVITALTAQNQSGVRQVVHIPPDQVEAQFLAVKDEDKPVCCKSGMLATAATVEVLADLLRKNTLPVFVIDPVLRSSSGYPLLEAPGFLKLKTRLLPLATAVTPNIPEAEKLSGMEIGSPGSLRDAARRIYDLGVRAVVLTGGHRESGPENQVIDLVYDGSAFFEVMSERLEPVNLHGTGCIHSAALAAYLHAGQSIQQAAEKAQRFVADRVRARAC